MKKHVLSLLSALLIAFTVSAQYAINEGFEGDIIPSGWTTLDTGNNPGTWKMDTYTPYKGAGHITLDCYETDSTNSGMANDWLITPQITVIEGDALVVWALSSDAEYKDNLHIMISKTGTAIPNFTIEVEAIGEVPGAYTKYEYVLTDIAGILAGDNIYIGFHTSSNGSYMNLDEIKVGPPSTQIHEEFENGIPANWTIVDQGDNMMPWNDTVAGGYNETSGVWVDCFNGDLDNSGRANDWLITPEFKFVGTDVLSFWLYGNDADYPDTVYVALSKNGVAVSEFDVFLDTIITTTAWTKYQYDLEQISGHFTGGQTVNAAVWALSNGSRVFIDNFRVGELQIPQVIKAYAISENHLALVYDAVVDANSIIIDDFTLSGSDNLTFSSIIADAVDANTVILTTSAAMKADNVIDYLINTSSGVEIEFYAGITPISYLKITNPMGNIESGIPATFRGIVSAVTPSRVWIADASGAYHGINTYDLIGETPAVGDDVLIYGGVDHYDNQSEIYPAVLIAIVTSGNAPFATTAITGSSIALSNTADENPAEQYEGALVKILNLTVIAFDGEYYLCSDDNETNNFNIGDRFGLFDGDLAIALEEGKSYNVTGILTGRSGEYLLAPRSASDIEEASAISNAESIRLAVFPNPFNNNLVVLNADAITEISICSIIGQRVMLVENNKETRVSINTSSLKSGIYTINMLMADKSQKSMKIIKN